MPPAVPDGTACDFDRSRLPASRAAVFGETADVGNKRLDWKSHRSEDRRAGRTTGGSPDKTRARRRSHKKHRQECLFYAHSFPYSSANCSSVNCSARREASGRPSTDSLPYAPTRLLRSVFRFWWKQRPANSRNAAASSIPSSRARSWGRKRIRVESTLGGGRKAEGWTSKRRSASADRRVRTVRYPYSGEPAAAVSLSASSCWIRNMAYTSRFPS